MLESRTFSVKEQRDSSQGQKGEGRGGKKRPREPAALGSSPAICLGSLSTFSLSLFLPASPQPSLTELDALAVLP